MEKPYRIKTIKIVDDFRIKDNIENYFYFKYCTNIKAGSIHNVIGTPLKRQHDYPNTLKCVWVAGLQEGKALLIPEKYFTVIETVERPTLKEYSKESDYNKALAAYEALR